MIDGRPEMGRGEYLGRAAGVRSLWAADPKLTRLFRRMLLVKGASVRRKRERYVTSSLLTVADKSVATAEEPAIAIGSDGPRPARPSVTCGSIR